MTEECAMYLYEGIQTMNKIIEKIEKKIPKWIRNKLEETRSVLECFLPLHRTPRVWSDRVKIVEVPLFSSYIFVRCPDTVLRDLLQVYGVIRIVFYNGKPAIVRQKEIDAIEDFLGQAAEHELCAGEEVEILTGAMKHVSGKVKKIKKNHLLLYLEQLGATVCVKMDDVARVNRLK